MGDDAFRVAGRPRGVRDRDRVPLVGGTGRARERLVRGEQGFVFVRAEALARAGVLAVADVDHDRRAAVLARRMRSAAPTVGASSRSVISTAHSQWCSCQAISGASSRVLSVLSTALSAGTA